MPPAEAVAYLRKELPEAILESQERLGQTALLIDLAHLLPVLSLLRPHFTVLIDLTGVDYVTPFAHTKAIYWLHNPANLARMRIAVKVGREETLPSVTSLWAGANWYERELYDLFGVKISGHPEMKRILLPDDWVGHPLRRDYPLTEVPVEFKQGVKPKIPSEIIPYVQAEPRRA